MIDQDSLDTKSDDALAFTEIAEDARAGRPTTGSESHDTAHERAAFALGALTLTPTGDAGRLVSHLSEDKAERLVVRLARLAAEAFVENRLSPDREGEPGE